MEYYHELQGCLYYHSDKQAFGSLIRQTNLEGLMLSDLPVGRSTWRLQGYDLMLPEVHVPPGPCRASHHTLSQSRYVLVSLPRNGVKAPQYPSHSQGV